MIAGDIEGIVSDYAEDAVFITQTGVLRGKGGIREASPRCSGICPTQSGMFTHGSREGDVSFLEWTAKAAA